MRDESADVPSAIAASGWMELLARAGYVVHGAIYLVIGGLAAGLAWGARGELADPPSAIKVMRRLPAGDVLVTIMAAGLVAYALWRFLQAIADPDGQGRTVKGVIVRVGRFGSGIGYSALAAFAARLVDGAAPGGGQANWAYRILTEPVGAALGVLVALVLFGIAADDVRKALTTNFGERLKDRQMGGLLVIATRAAGSLGFTARAVVLSFGAVYLLQAVFQSEPESAKGFEGMLASLMLLPNGHWVLGLVALGLGAYGAFMVQVGVFRRHPF